MSKNLKIFFKVICFILILFISWSMDDLTTVAFSAARKPATKPAQTPRKTDPKTPQKLEEEAKKTPAAAASPDVIPQARIEEAEQAFTRAWDAFIQRDYWRATDQLNRALSANIFLVDVYFLRGLVQRRLGDFDAAQKSLSSFLEVRTRDEVTPYILQGTAENKADINSIISLSPYPVNRLVPKIDLYTGLKVSYNRPYSAKGLGKLSGFVEDLCFADTLGDHLYIRLEKNYGGFEAVKINSPIVGLLPGDGSLFSVNISGDVHKIENNSAELMGGLKQTMVSDAAFVSGNEIIVTDQVERSVSIYSFPDLELLDKWSPKPEGNYLFEPVAVDCYGEWAAVADRANGRIHFLNLRDYVSFSVEEIAVRDVIWDRFGTLISVNENSEAAAHTVDFAKKAAVRESLRRDMKDAWALFKYEKDIYCANILGTELWQIKDVPTVTASHGFFSMYSPSLKAETFSMSATLTTHFQSWANSVSPNAISIWNNGVITTSITRAAPRAPYAICFARGGVDALVPTLRVISVQTCAELYESLKSTWLNQRDLITNFVLDSRITYQREDLVKLTAFCLFNGIDIDVWAQSMPTIELLKASAATNGKVYYSLGKRPVFYPFPNTFNISIAFPFKLASSGYPDRATLSIYAGLGQISARDWMPIWIDLLGK